MRFLRTLAALVSILNFIFILSSQLNPKIVRTVGFYLSVPTLFVIMLLLQIAVCYTFWRLFYRVGPEVEPAAQYVLGAVVSGLSGFLCASDSLLFSEMIGYPVTSSANYVSPIGNLAILFGLCSLCVGSGVWFISLSSSSASMDATMLLTFCFALSWVISILVWVLWLSASFQGV